MSENLVNIEIVKQLYDAFFKKDINKILGVLESGCRMGRTGKSL